MTDHRVHSIAFDGDAVTLTFSTSTDVRVDGMVGVAQQVQISMDHPDYAETAELLHRQAVKFLREVMEDWTESQPWEPADAEEDLEMGGRR